VIIGSNSARTNGDDDEARNDVDRHFYSRKKKVDDDRHFIPKKRMTVTVIASSLILKSVIKVVEMRSRLKRRI